MESLHAWLYLSSLPGLGPMGVKKLLNIACPQVLLRYSYSELCAMGVAPELARSIAQPDWRRIDASLRWLEQSDLHHIVTLADADYPAALAAISDAPPVLYVKGQRHAIGLTQLAVVGSRHASPPARRLTTDWCHQLTRAGLVITSGLALGIDGCAHQGALQAQGVTVAVLANGLGRIYPKRHQGLAHAIVGRGALVSENPPDTQPRAGLFPRRNRIISGLSKGVLIVEAALPSGTLTTAQSAANQGRDVFVLPGAVGDPLKAGCHWLIKQGATLVDNVDDIVQSWPYLLDNGGQQAFFVDKLENSVTKRVRRLPKSPLLDNVGDRTIAVDELVAITGLSVQQVLSELLELELQGEVASVAGGYVRMRRG